jgi:L-amino acid N-acyltransferase YncA
VWLWCRTTDSRGVGRALVRARIDESRRQRAPELFYFANARNEATIRLHEQFGFHEIQRPFELASVTFNHSVGVLFRLDLASTDGGET